MFTVRSTPSTIAPPSLSTFRPSMLSSEFLKHLVSTKSLVSFPLSSGIKTSPYFAMQPQLTKPTISPHNQPVVSSEKKRRKCAQCGQFRKGHICPFKVLVRAMFTKNSRIRVRRIAQRSKNKRLRIIHPKRPSRIRLESMILHLLMPPFSSRQFQQMERINLLPIPKK